MRVPLIGSSYQGVSVSFDSQRSVNLMEEKADSPNAKSPSALISTPGLAKIQNSDGTYISFSGIPIRGMFSIPNTSGFFQACLIVAGASLYRIEPDTTELSLSERLFYNTTLVGTLDTIATSNQQVNIVTFAVGLTQVVLTAGEGYAYVYTLASGALSAPVVFDVTPGAFVPLNDVVYLAGYFIGLVNSGTGLLRRVYYSTVNDGSAWSALDYFTVEETRDFIKKLMVKDGHLWVFTDNSIIIYAPTGDANNPFAPIVGSTISRGCVRRLSVCEVDDSFIWLGSDQNRSGMVVYRTNGGSAQRISNGFVDSRIQKISDDFGFLGIDELVCYSSIERGHTLYKMHFHKGKTTLVYDATTGKWHERGWWNVTTGEYEEEIGWVHAAINRVSLVGDRRTTLDAGVTGIYRLSETLTNNDVYYQDAAAHTAGTDQFIRRERVSPIISGPNHERLFINEIELQFEVGNANANDPSSNPKASIQVSFDSGHTYGIVRTRSIGKAGKYKGRCRFLSLGSAYDFVVKIILDDSVQYRLVAAYADIDAGD